MLRSFGPGLMGGLTFGKWVQLLGENHFAVTPSCLPRAIAISFQSIQNTLFHWTDQRRLGSELKDVVVPPPLFVLGHWRNGTTLLHNARSSFRIQLGLPVASVKISGRRKPQPIHITTPMMMGKMNGSPTRK